MMKKIIQFTWLINKTHNISRKRYHESEKNQTKGIEVMRQKWGILLCVISAIGVLASGCDSTKKNANTNEYVEGSDFQYMQEGNGMSSGGGNVQKGKNGYYFLTADYLYYLEDGTNNLIPLCGKADCLHDKETDDEKKEECNAYAPGMGNSAHTLSYCNGYLYYIRQEISERETLYRVSEDGSQKEMLYQWEEDTMITYWSVHRDVLYYSPQSYSVEKLEDGSTSMVEHHSICALDLSSAKTIKTLYTVEDDIDVLSLANPVEYGNYLYFTLIGYHKTDEEITDDNFTDYMVSETYIYNLQTEELGVVTLPDLRQGECVTGVVFWQGKILIQSYDMLNQKDGVSDVYVADLDGSNPEVVMEDVPQNDIFISDGVYLYRTNAVMSARWEAEEEETYWVYDADYHLVDSYQVPYDTKGGDAVGHSDIKIGVYKDDNKWGVTYWDKSKIGTYQGDTVELIDIPYGEL